MKSILKMGLVVCLAANSLALAEENPLNPPQNGNPDTLTDVELSQTGALELTHPSADDGHAFSAHPPEADSSNTPAPTSPNTTSGSALAPTSDPATANSPSASSLKQTLSVLLSKLGYSIVYNEDGSLSIKAPAHQIVLTAKLREDRQELELVGQRKDQIAGRILSLRDLDENNLNSKAAEIVTLARGICRELTPTSFKILERDTQRQVVIAVLLLTTVSAYSVLHARTTLFQRIGILFSVWMVPKLWNLIAEEASYQWNK